VIFNPIEIPLCNRLHAHGETCLSARLDEATMTYCVLDADNRVLRSQLPSLSEARRWASAYTKHPHA
jgi:hypothetical protein